MNPEKGVVMMCDLCGGKPKCIDFCPEEALELVTEETAVSWLSVI
jgi:Fe-S-cluster-containing hydrogenase component 2